MSTGGATNDTASYDGGLRGDAGYASGLDAAVDATPDVSSGRSSPTDSQGN
jgi:hypothetical protein